MASPQPNSGSTGAALCDLEQNNKLSLTLLQIWKRTTRRSLSIHLFLDFYYIQIQGKENKISRTYNGAVVN
jgi:hypothetical protein